MEVNSMEIRLKRAYDPPSPSDGYRVLVDRLWPRGVKKEALELDEWCKEIAPSTELRRRFHHDPEKFEEFTREYTGELAASDEPRKLLERAGNQQRITLVYGAKDTEHNQAVVLKAYLETLLKRGK